MSDNLCNVFVFIFIRFTEKRIMDNIEEVLEAIFIAVVVVNFLLNTGRNLKAIELCNECLIILNDKGHGMRGELAKKVYFLIYYTMFRVYSVIADYTSAIQYGNEVLFVSPECGKKASVAIEMAEIYRSQNKHIEAK